MSRHRLRSPGSSRAATSARSVVGATDADGKGISGLELASNRQAPGRRRQRPYERASGGSTIAGGSSRPTRPSRAPTSTSRSTSRCSTRPSRRWPHRWRPPAPRAGMAIVSRPSTGEVLAMASVGRTTTTTSSRRRRTRPGVGLRARLGQQDDHRGRRPGGRRDSPSTMFDGPRHLQARRPRVHRPRPAPHRAVDHPTSW